MLAAGHRQRGELAACLNSAEIGVLVDMPAGRVSQRAQEVG